MSALSSSRGRRRAVVASLRALKVVCNDDDDGSECRDKECKGEDGERDSSSVSRSARATLLRGGIIGAIAGGSLRARGRRHDGLRVCKRGSCRRLSLQVNRLPGCTIPPDLASDEFTKEGVAPFAQCKAATVRKVGHRRGGGRSTTGSGHAGASSKRQQSRV